MFRCASFSAVTLGLRFVHFWPVVKGIPAVIRCYGSATLGTTTPLSLLRQSTVLCLTRGSQCLHFFSLRRVLLLHQGQTKCFDPMPLPFPSALGMQIGSHRFALKCRCENSNCGQGVMLGLHCCRQVLFIKLIPSYSIEIAPQKTKPALN